MTAPRGVLADYLALRRALGFKLDHHERLLGQFVDYLEHGGQERISVEQAVAWATLPAGASPSWWADRLSIVRGFAAYLHLLDPSHQVPPRDLLPPRQHRATPYLYSAEEIERLMRAAQTMKSQHRRSTYRTLIGLLAATGMRIGEALALDRRDLDHADHVLVVRHGKFGKSRELPLHPTTLEALARYLRRRERPHTTSPAVFVSSSTGSRLAYCDVQRTFRRLTRHAGLGSRSNKCRPRLHDLRHSFAVQPPSSTPTATGTEVGERPTAAAAVHLSGPRRPEEGDLLLVPIGSPGAARARRPRAARAPSPRGAAMTTLAPTLQAFFTDRLIRQRQASGHTIAAYRDTFRLLLAFAVRTRAGKQPVGLEASTTSTRP